MSGVYVDVPDAAANRQTRRRPTFLGYEVCGAVFGFLGAHADGHFSMSTTTQEVAVKIGGIGYRAVTDFERAERGGRWWTCSAKPRDHVLLFMPRSHSGAG